MTTSFRPEPILLSSEQRLIEVVTDAYGNAQARSFVEQFATQISTDGKEVKIRMRDIVASFKDTGLSEKDHSNVSDIEAYATFESIPTFKAVSCVVPDRMYRDSDGEAAEVLGQWGVVVGKEAGWYNSRLALEQLIGNATSIMGGAMFGSRTVFTGYTYDNRIGSCDLTPSATYEAAGKSLAQAKRKMRTIKTKAGVAKEFSEVALLAPSSIADNLRFATRANTITSTDNTVSSAFGTRIVEVPELGADFGGSDDVAYLIGIPAAGLRAFVKVDREGLEVPVYGPGDRPRSKEWVYDAQFRDMLHLGDPTCILKVQKAAL